MAKRAVVHSHCDQERLDCPVCRMQICRILVGRRSVSRILLVMRDWYVVLQSAGCLVTGASCYTGCEAAGLLSQIRSEAAGIASDLDAVSTPGGSAELVRGFHPLRPVGLTSLMLSQSRNSFRTGPRPRRSRLTWQAGRAASCRWSARLLQRPWRTRRRLRQRSTLWPLSTQEQRRRRPCWQP